MKLLWRVFLAVLVLCVLAEIVVTLHPSFDIESLFGFHAWFGFLACVAMIGVAKGLSSAAEAARHLLRTSAMTEVVLHPGLVLIVGALAIPWLRGHWRVGP